MKFSRLLSLALTASLGFAAVNSTASSTAQVVQNMGNGQVDWSKGEISVTGSGAAPSKGNQSTGQKRLLAQRAAVSDAYRQLAEMVNGVQVDSETLVKDFVVESDIVRTKVSALIKGAKMGNFRYMNDGTVEVTMTMGVYGQNSLSSVMMPEVIEKKHIQTQPSISTPNNPPPSSDPVQATGGYTGVIVDCRGLGVSPAMSPQIIDAAGKDIYIGDRPIDPDMVVNIGIVGYAESLSQAQSNSRIGRNPLIVKAVKAGGRHKTDAVISAESGNLLLSADKGGDFLSKSKVIFVVDK